MRQNVNDLVTFYKSRLGAAAARMAKRRLDAVWPKLSGCTMLGFGYCPPFLQDFSGQNSPGHDTVGHAKKCVLAMPQSQGAVVHALRRGNIACLVNETRLPFQDGEFDRVLVVHGLEDAEDPARLMSELWRVTRPEGRIIIITANRAGLWARTDQSPFGAGRPFSRRQLRDLLVKAKFQPTFWSGALHVPPVAFLCRPSIAFMFERFGETVWPGFSGLIMTEAIKRLYIESDPVEAVSVKRTSIKNAPVSKQANRVNDKKRG